MKRTLPLAVCVAWFVTNGLLNSLLAGNNPGVFIENKGQFYDQRGNARPDLLFGGQTQGLTYHILKDGISYQQVRGTNMNPTISEEFPLQHLNRLEGDDSREVEIYRVDVRWIGANQNYTIERGQPSGQTANYYHVANGAEPALHVKGYETVRLKNLWNGVDLLYYTRNGHLESDWILERAEDFHQIRFYIAGAELSTDEEGFLIMKTPFGELREGGLKVYQNNKLLPAKWVLSGNVVSFEIEGFEPHKPLRIDPPVRIWGTYFGGTEKEYANANSTDDSGHVYLAGFTKSLNNIATVGAFQTTYSGRDDAFLVKYNSQGQILWSTYLGGTQDDRIYTVKVNKEGEVFIGGYSWSQTGIASPGAYMEARSLGMCAFIAKINPNGHRVWGTYYGGTNNTYVNSLALDNLGNIFLAGGTTSDTGISLPGAHQLSLAGIRDGFIVKFTGDGQPLWATYYGGDGQDDVNAIALDADCNIYGVGNTASLTGIDTSGAHQKVYGGNGDAFVFKMDSSGSPVWSSYFGGSENDYGSSCAVDGLGNLVITGWTLSPNQISTLNSYQPTSKGDWDAFVAKFNANGVQQWGTYFGGEQSEYGHTCVLGSNGNIYLAGTTRSSEDIASPGAFLSDLGGDWSAYYAIFNSSGTRLASSYYCGEDGISSGVACAVNSENHFFMSGIITSTANVRTPGMYPQNYSGGEDVYLVKIQDCAAQPNIGILDGEDKVLLNQTYVYSIDSQSNVAYWWHIDNGNIVSGQGTANIEVIWTLPNGTLSIEATYQNGCNNFVSKTVSLATGNYVLKDQVKEILLYPNPSKGIVFMTLDEADLGKQYTVLDTWGRVLKEGVIQQETTEIELSHLVDGVYLMKVGDSSRKLLKVAGK